jgi:hypothetical protein
VEDGCIYRYGIICLHTNDISSLEGGGVGGCLYRWYVNRLYHTCTYNRLPEDEPSGSKHVEYIVKFYMLV